MSKDETGPRPTAPADRMLPDAAQGEIAKLLRDSYGQLLAEPLPEQFSILLQKLAKPEDQK